MIDLAGQSANQPIADQQPNLASINQTSTSHLQEVLAGVLVLVAIIGTGAMYFLKQSQITYLDRAQSEKTTIQTQLKTGVWANTLATAQQISQAISILGKTTTTTVSIADFMGDMQATTIGGVVLSSVSVDDANNLKIEGRADSYQVVANYLSTLRASPYIASVSLVSATNQTAINGLGLVFLISGKVQQPKVTATPTVTPSVSTGVAQ